MKKDKSQSDLRTYKIIAKASCLFFVACFLGQFIMGNRYAVKNEVLQESLEKKMRLEREIALLEHRNSLISSLSAVEERALEMGFVSMEASVMRIGPVVVAALPDN